MMSIKTSLTNSASDVMYGGSAASAFGFLSGIDVISIIGAVAAIGGFAVNAYAKYKENRMREAENQRHEEEHQLAMQKVRLEIERLKQASSAETGFIEEENQHENE